LVAEVRALDRRVLVFLDDESGVTTTMTRAYAPAPKGQRARAGRGAVRCGGWWRRLTLLGALGVDGLVTVMSVAAAAPSTAVFLADLTELLIPELCRRQPGAVVIMDHLAPHRAAKVGAVLAAAGLRLLYLPRYSPDLSPIEPCWSKVKTLLRAAAARTKEALDTRSGP
jgi:hypothetical protein